MAARSCFERLSCITAPHLRLSDIVDHVPFADRRQAANVLPNPAIAAEGRGRRVGPRRSLARRAMK
jgi:hypothetical protein